MQEILSLEEQYLQILQEVRRKLNRKAFCELHQISESKLSRILNGKIQPDIELLDYLAMSCGKRIRMSLI